MPEKGSFIIIKYEFIRKHNNPLSMYACNDSYKILEESWQNSWEHKTVPQSELDAAFTSFSEIKMTRQSSKP